VKPAVVAALGLLIAGPAMAAPEIIAVTYRRERDVMIPVTYVNAADGSVAVLMVEGRQVALPQAPSADGARYGVMGGVSGYFWWSKGDGGMLSWFDGDHHEEVTLFMECKEATG